MARLAQLMGCRIVIGRLVISILARITTLRKGKESNRGSVVY